MKKNMLGRVLFYFLIGICFLFPVDVSWSLNRGSIPEELIKEIREMDLGRDGYRLCVPLTEEQWTKARANSLPPTVDRTVRFKDGDLQIVADAESGMVLLISEYHKVWPSKKLKDVIGEFTLAYGFPTTTAHGTTYYWFFSAEGELLNEDNYYNYLRTHGKDSIIATIKVQSGSIGSGERKKDNLADDKDIPDSGYYLIYSNPILELYASSGKLGKKNK